VPAAGVPANVAVPSGSSTNVTPLGSVPVSLNVGGVGKEWPVLTVNVPAVPTVKVVPLALVILGTSFTVRVNGVCTASGLTPLLAVIVRE
jgi:hypothetical protein